MKKNFLFLTFESNLATRFSPIPLKKLTDLQKFRNSTLFPKKTYQRYSHDFSYKKKLKKKKVNRNKNQNQTHSCSSLHRGLNRWHYPKKTPPPQKFKGGERFLSISGWRLGNINRRLWIHNSFFPLSFSIHCVFLGLTLEEEMYLWYVVGSFERKQSCRRRNRLWRKINLHARDRL